MEIRQSYRDAVKILEAGRSLHQGKLADLDKTIERLRNENEANPAIAMIESGRVELQTELNTLNVEIERIQNLANGQPSPEGSADGTVKLHKGQYKGVRKLATAVQMYLTHCVPQGESVRVTDLVNALNFAGATVQIRNGKDRGQRRPVQARHVRIMAADYKTGFSSKGLTSPFVLTGDDMIRLKAEPEVEEPKAKGRSDSGGRERPSANLPQVSVLSGSG